MSDIFLVEDNEDELELAMYAIESCSNHPVLPFRDAVSAMDNAKAFAENGDPIPKLIILDIGLPGISGIEALQEFRQIPGFEDVPIILLTSSNDPGDIVSGKVSGANMYVRKPLELSEFKERIGLLIHNLIG